MAHPRSNSLCSLQMLEGCLTAVRGLKNLRGRRMRVPRGLIEGKVQVEMWFLDGRLR